MPFRIEICKPHYFSEVQQHIQQFSLDDRFLLREEFLTLSAHSKLLGFGRIREHRQVSEMCTLGVIENERKKGFGKTLVSALIQKATQPLYLVCIMPSYFESFGFSVCHNYPEVMQEKLRYCNQSLSVKEEYVVMALHT